jgi:hypothetical protein
LVATLVEGRRIGDQLAQAELNIEAEVRNAIQALQSAESRMQAATDARVASEELYESEQRQFRGGATTFFVVRQRLTDLAVARALELRAACRSKQGHFCLQSLSWCDTHRKQRSGLEIASVLHPTVHEV